MKWRYFIRRKNEMVEILIDFIKNIKSKDQEMVQFLRMDNSGENISLKNKLEKLGIEVQVEFTSPNTPEQNGQIERSFATLWGWVRAMLNDSGVDEEMRSELWAECASTATKLCNIVSRLSEKSSRELFYGKESRHSKNLRIFGETGIKMSRTTNLPEKINIKDVELKFLYE
jgi:hypothetical protein